MKDTLIPGTAAFSTKTVTSIKPRRLSPPGNEKMVSKFLGKEMTIWLERHGHHECAQPQVPSELDNCKHRAESVNTSLHRKAPRMSISLQQHSGREVNRSSTQVQVHLLWGLSVSSMALMAPAPPPNGTAEAWVGRSFWFFSGPIYGPSHHSCQEHGVLELQLPQVSANPLLLVLVVIVFVDMTQRNKHLAQDHFAG